MDSEPELRGERVRGARTVAVRRRAESHGPKLFVEGVARLFVGAAELLGDGFECFAAGGSGPFRTTYRVVDGPVFAGSEVDETCLHQLLDGFAGRKIADRLEQEVGESVFDSLFVNGHFY